MYILLSLSSPPCESARIWRGPTEDLPRALRMYAYLHIFDLSAIAIQLPNLSTATPLLPEYVDGVVSVVASGVLWW